MAEKPIVAIMYDFDKTLCTQDMQNYSFIPNLGMTPDQFWGETGEFGRKSGVEKILAYMYMMVSKCREKNIPLTREYLNSLGKDIKYFEGVKNWFERINNYGKERGIKVEHYLVSSGTKEIIEGCEIFNEFKEVYGCEFHFDRKTKEASWPKLAINYTAKTQFYFRISKGVLDVSEDNKLNRKSSTRRVPHRNIIYIGDGMTDIPIMLVVKNNGGTSIAVYNKEDNKENVKYLHDEGRVDYICTANYKKGSQIDKVVQLTIDKISILEELEEKQETLSRIE